MKDLEESDVQIDRGSLGLGGAFWPNGVVGGQADDQPLDFGLGKVSELSTVLKPG